jgi:hypothetical protein
MLRPIAVLSSRAAHQREGFGMRRRDLITLLGGVRHNGRRVVVAGWASAREMFANVTAERDQLRRELFEVQRERDEYRERLIELSAAVRARQDAEAEVRALYREREIRWAEAAQRDPSRRLN